jgi:hypothetical protein
MRSKLHATTWLVVILLFITTACRKDKVETIAPAFDLQLLKGGTWSDVQNSSSACNMRFRFYGNSNVTYTFRTASYPSLKYDSFPNGRYELILPDTLRLYDRSWNYYGYIQVVNLTSTELHSRMPGYTDIMIFKKEN